MVTKPIPDGFHTVTPYLMIQDASGLIRFLKQAFDAEEICRVLNPDGTIMHAQVKIGDSMVMMSEATDEYPPMPSLIHLYVKDMDRVYDRALQAGATSMKEPRDEFYGDRGGGVKDPFGNQWWIATHIEEVSPEELMRRKEALCSGTEKP